MLFDLAADPNEEINVVADHPGVVEQMRGLMADRFQAEIPGLEA
jgi:hypothetical protein